MNSHKKKPDVAWERTMSDYALTGKLGRGGAPQKSDVKWHKIYEKISACPVTEQLKALGYIQQTKM